MRLRVGGPVPGRKRKSNPETITGRPMIGTFQGLGMPSTVRAIRLQANAAGVRTGKGGSANRNLPRGHLCHKIHPKRDIERGLIRRHYEEARTLSLLLDRTQVDWPAYDRLIIRYESHVAELVYVGAERQLNELVAMESKRGQMRGKIAIRRCKAQLV